VRARCADRRTDVSFRFLFAGNYASDARMTKRMREREREKSRRGTPCFLTLSRPCCSSTRMLHRDTMRKREGLRRAGEIPRFTFSFSDAKPKLLPPRRRASLKSCVSFSFPFLPSRPPLPPYSKRNFEHKSLLPHEGRRENSRCLFIANTNRYHRRIRASRTIDTTIDLDTRGEISERGLTTFLDDRLWMWCMEAESTKNP